MGSIRSARYGAASASGNVASVAVAVAARSVAWPLKVSSALPDGAAATVAVPAEAGVAGGPPAPAPAPAAISRAVPLNWSGLANGSAMAVASSTTSVAASCAGRDRVSSVQFTRPLRTASLATLTAQGVAPL